MDYQSYYNLNFSNTYRNYQEFNQTENSTNNTSFKYTLNQILKILQESIEGEQDDAMFYSSLLKLTDNENDKNLIRKYHIRRKET